MHPAVAQSLLVKKPLPMRGFLIGSAIAHGALLGAIVASSYLRLTPAIDLNQQPIKASLVRLGKPRDEKLLPQKDPPLPPEEKKPEAPTPEPPKPPEPKGVVAIPDVKAIPSEASKKSGEKSAADRRKQLFSAFSKTAGGRTRELDGQLDGDPNGDSATAEGERYWALLTAGVRRNYDVSQTIPEQERLHLKAQVQVLIGRTGELLRVQVIRSSGNELFDNAVVSAVKKAAPFSPPPDHLRDALQRKGVALEFRP